MNTKGSNLGLTWGDDGVSAWGDPDGPDFQKLDTVVQLGVLGIVNTVPTTLAEGARYIIGTSPSGVFTGHANDVALWSRGAWWFYHPALGWTAGTPSGRMDFNGTAWVASTGGGNGGGGGISDAPADGNAYARENGGWLALPTAYFSGAYADLTGKPTLFSGAYADLTGKPTIPASPVNADWSSNSGLSQILNKPTLFSGAYADLTGKPTLFSGAYADLTGKPTLPSSYFSGAYADLTGKPTLFSGAYADLTGKPTILPEAPTDGSTYGRNNGAWVVVPTSGGGSSPAGTIRNIATRCRHDYQVYTGRTSLGCYGKTFHVNQGDTVYGPQVVLGNWYANNVNEFAGPASVNEWISIEYPAGEFTLATWDTLMGGTARNEFGTIVPGADGMCDPVPITIPHGAGFWVHRVSQWADGALHNFNVSASAAGGPTGSDALFFDWIAAPTGNDVRATLTSNTVAPTGPVTMSQVRFPLAIVGKSTVASVMIIGDSRASGRSDASGTLTVAANPAGQYGSADWGRWGMGEIARSVGVSRPYVNLGCETDSARTFNTVAHTFRARQQAYHTDVVCQYGVNDVNLAGRTAAALEVDLAAIYALFPSKRVWQSTIAPVSTSTDAWATTANQTTATTNGQRVLANNWIRTVPAPLAGIFDVADVLETARDSGIWAVDPLVGVPTGDGLHEAPSNYKKISMVKVIDPARFTPI